MKIIRTAGYMGKANRQYYKKFLDGAPLGLQEQAIEVIINYTITPETKPIYNPPDKADPGSAREFEILSIIRLDNKQDITDLVLSKMPNFAQEIEEEVCNWENDREQAQREDYEERE